VHSATPAAVHRVPASYLSLVCRLAERWDVSHAALLEGTGVSDAQLTDPSCQLDLSTALRLLERARELTAEPALGIHLGLQTQASVHGYLGFGALAAPTLGEAIGLMLKYAPTRFTGIGLHGHVESGVATLTVEEHVDFGSVRDVVLFALLIGLWHTGGTLLGRAMQLTLDLPIARPDYFARFEHLLLPVRFDRPVCQLSGPAAGLSSPVTLADAAAFRLMQAECDRLGAELGGSQSLAVRVRKALPKPSGGFRSFDEVASLLKLSPRTLRRRLADEALSFAALLHEERKARAVLLLRVRDLPLDEVAARLGYSDASAFARAFQRWAGESPAAYRRSAGSRTGAA
jgi:AraC-like DNA-binding protein